MKINNQTALITGGASGIGLALTKRFLDAGNKVIIVGRNKQKLESVKSLSPGLITYQCDLSNYSQVESLKDRIANKHSDLSILVNNAGIQYNYRFTEDSDVINKIAREVEINLAAPIKLVSLLLPILLRQKSAAIINVSSGLGLVPKESAPVYCATKAGIHIFTKALRYQLENTSVRVFEIIPPLVDTDMTQGRGKGKISADDLAKEFFREFAKNHYEINIGKVKLLRLINRLSPALAEKILRKG
ncbi:MAG: SDR family NAD(P)-dependent oxidoreductase [FCB group bacterium]|nr:SDR family NAD(P)-dependent oxidoreductase [FCB group bacterium]